VLDAGCVEIVASAGGSIAELWPVDGATIRVNAQWSGAAEVPRYAQTTGKTGPESVVELRDRYYEAVADYGRRLATLERVIGGPLDPAPPADANVPCGPG